MTQSGHQEAFEFDQTRLGDPRYDGLPQNPAQNREQFFLELHVPFWLCQHISPNRRDPWWNMLAGTLNQFVFSGDST